MEILELSSFKGKIQHTKTFSPKNITEIDLKCLIPHTQPVLLFINGMFTSNQPFLEF